MEIILQIALLIIGFAILIKGADWLVNGASSIATNFKVSKTLIGLTIVAFGTSAPELAVSISSLASGSTDMLLGNVIGSNIINILLLIGVGALICPITVNKNTVKKELPILLLISTALVVLFLDMSLANAATNSITRSDAIICLLFFAIFLYYLIVMAKRNHEIKSQKSEKPQYKLGKSFFLTVVGLVGLVLGSQLVVNSASFLASTIGVSDRIIALTVIAIGTSLPELVTTIIAARHKETDLIVGNIIGSNIFNICIVMGLPVAIFGTITPESFQAIDLIMLVSSAVLLFILTRRDHKISRVDGALMLTIFAIYYGCIIYGALA
ncbi:MAG: calcium/sodium antiporter [Candidatus Saccharibacteria bacterium]|nr:calcium/sodium antiporter [Candidatus Saccharibacteria bacterium]